MGARNARQRSELGLAVFANDRGGAWKSAADLASGGVIAIGSGGLTKVHNPDLYEGTA